MSGLYVAGFEDIIARVWRTELSHPGWAVLPVLEPLDTFAFRRTLWQFVTTWNRLASGGVPQLQAERFGRFDQQTTSKFHRDGGPSESILVLGYEPTPVTSRVEFADAAGAAAAAGLGVNAYLAAHNPMTTAGAARLRPFVTAVDWPSQQWTIVVINNSLAPDDSPSPTLGLLHRADVLHPDPSAKRVINSIGLCPVGSYPELPNAELALDRFLTRDDLD